MSYLTLKNDRIRRRKARALTFLITMIMFAAAAYGLGLLEDLPALYQQYFGGEVVNSNVA